MKSKIVFTIFLFCAAISLLQGQTAAEMFIKLPESAFLPLTVANRTDLISLYKAGKNATVKNRLDDSCYLLRLTDDYLQIRAGNNTMELFLLPMINDSKTVGLIQTVCAPACDSHLEFYTTAWKKLSTPTFITLAGKYDFLKEGIRPEDEKVKNALIPLDISLMQLRYDPDNRELQQYYTTPDYLSEPERAGIKPYLNEVPKRFKWNFVRFE